MLFYQWWNWRPKKEDVWMLWSFLGLPKRLGVVWGLGQSWLERWGQPREARQLSDSVAFPISAATLQGEGNLPTTCSWTGTRRTQCDQQGQHAHFPESANRLWKCTFGFNDWQTRMPSSPKSRPSRIRSTSTPPWSSSWPQSPPWHDTDRSQRLS